MARVLVVDDHETIRDLLREFLAAKGYEVCEAATGTEALKRLREDRPHLVLLDINLPDLSGLEVLRQAKTIHPALRVVMLTGVLDEALRRQALQQGACDYVTKPMDLKHLEQVVWYSLSTMTMG